MGRSRRIPAGVGVTGPWLGLLLVLSACDRPVITIERTRERGQPGRLNASSDDRFGPAKSDEEKFAELIRWTVPSGWEQLPAQRLRAINLRVGKVQCYVTMLTGGGAVSNINRWRSQMGHEPATAVAIGALKTVRLFGRDAYHLDVSGAFGSMNGGSQPDFRLLARYAQFPAFALSVKMIGPQAEVAEAAANFVVFCDSLEFEESVRTQMQKEPGGAAHGTANGGGAGFDRSKVSWTLPAGWKLGKGSSMRHVTFAMDGQVECYILFLPGDGGGVSANINRWLGQIQLPHLDQAGIAALERIDILAGKGPLVVGYSKAGRGLIGSFLSVPGQTMFIKMVGPAAGVKKYKDGFVAFCKSLKVEK